MTFEEAKSAKLRRLPVLRVFNMLGMVAWSHCEYEIAKQKLRLLHPLSWVWILIMLVISIFAQGIPDTISDAKSAWKQETLWF